MARFRVPKAKLCCLYESSNCVIIHLIFMQKPLLYFFTRFLIASYKLTDDHGFPLPPRLQDFIETHVTFSGWTFPGDEGSFVLFKIIALCKWFHVKFHGVQSFFCANLRCTNFLKLNKYPGKFLIGRPTFGCKYSFFFFS